MEKTCRNCQGPSLEPLIEIIKTLRGENGCPWDRKQTPETMWKCLVEEVYELLDAIEKSDSREICEEIGDVLFQLVFIAELYREKGEFPIDLSIDRVKEKMIRRHPHVYGKAVLQTEADLHRIWEKIKTEEKKKTGRPTDGSVLDTVPAKMPALLRCCKISERAVKAGFDWEDMKGVLEKAEEEWRELGHALETGDQASIADEFGDVLFTLANVARFAGVHPEVCLAKSTEKFERRFRFMEKELGKNKSLLKDVSRAELDVLWERAKEKYDCNS